MSEKTNQHLVSRRQFAVLAAASAAGLNAQTKKQFPIGLQQTAVGRNIQQDLNGTLRAIAKMGYDLIEFSAGTFMNWTPDQARQVRALLDELNLKCRSTHNEIVSFSGDGLSKSIELNQIIGSDTLVSVRGPGPTPGGGRGAARGGTPAAPPTLDAWKRFSEQLSQAADRIRSAKMTLGFHNHAIEFEKVEGMRPIDILAANRDITSFHLNIGLCLQGGGDPIASIQQSMPGTNPVAVGSGLQRPGALEGDLQCSRGEGGLQFYLLQRTDGLFLVEREGTDLLDFAQKDLQYFRQLHG